MPGFFFGYNRHMRFAALSFLVALGLALGIVDECRAGSPGGTLALTFSYSPKGSGPELAGGYKDHLRWHEERNDSILWYAWFVVEGQRLGHMIDGAFGVTGKKFDERIDPAGDAADAVEKFLPYAEMQYRRVYRLHEGLSTSTFLEDRTPSPLMQVVYYRVHPGMQIQFESALQEIAGGAGPGQIEFTIYEMLTGADDAQYAFFAPLDGFAGFDRAATNLESAARRVLSGERLVAVMAQIAAASIGTTSEVWQYRADLSLLGDSE